MKRTTKKLSGTGLEQFLRGYYAGYAGIDDGLARQLARDGSRAFASVRVRRIAWCDWKNRLRVLGRNETRMRSGTGTQAATGMQDAADGDRVPAKPRETKPVPVAEPSPAPVAEAQPFDPYAIGLIPTYQREGAAGLLAKLGSVATIEHLRAIARAQQVSLPAELRGPDADISAVRDAIVAAVGRRIADRRAAAG